MKRKVVLITGATSGIGLEFAHIYAQHNYDLLIIARSEDKLLKLKAELETRYAIHVYVFVQDLSTCKAANNVYEFTRKNNLDIEILINNAGFGDYGNFYEYDMQKQINLLQVNIVTLVELTRYFLPPMLERDSGQIINMSSVAAFCAGPKMSLYYASKSFVRSFSEALSEEVKNSNVNILALCPGPTSTGFENAANMKESKMFHFIKPKTAKQVALAGYNASCKGKTLKYYGIEVKLFNIMERLVPRFSSRKFARIING